MNLKKLKYPQIFIACLILIGLDSCTQKTVQTDESKQPVDLVYPQLDSENSRWFFFSSACRPFGMVNLSPDNQIDGAWGTGYRYNTDTIKGFSHIHAWQLSGLSVMPVTFSEENKGNVFTDFFSEFSHETEKVAPGYHLVELERYHITAELTSTKRVGFHRYAFPENSQAAILFNLNTMLGPCENINGTLEKTGDSELSGKLDCAPTNRRPKPFTVFFKIELNSPIKNIDFDAATGNYLVQLENHGKEVLMKAALSYTSNENAELNLQTELPGWDFDKVVSDSKEEWNSLLSRIKIEGGTETQQSRFYTDLWHALQGRRIISDINGAYPDNTGEVFRVGQLPLDENGKPGFNQYNSDSFWGAQWTINTLWGIAYPEIYEEFVYSMMQYYKDGGLVPRGPSGGNYTFVMTGASSTPFIVSAIQKGIVKNDLEEIYQALKKNHMPGGIMEKAGYEHRTNLGGGLNYYIENGFVPYPLPDGKFGFHQDGAMQTLEYAYQDWTLAQMAKTLGHTNDYIYFKKRSENYKNLYDQESSWIRPKDVNGKWRDPYDPYEYQNGFVESNGAQATWFVPHDLPGLAELMGGKEAAAEKLNTQFETAEALNFTSGTSHDKELHPEYKRVPINYGNQPSMQTAFVFNQLDRPDLTQFWSRKVVEKAFSGLSPATGYNGDEDQGLMGSLSVLLKLGLFQMNGGTEENPEYQLGSPIFDKAVIQLNPKYYPGNEFTIETVGNSAENVFIQSVILNDKVIQQNWIQHDDIVKGGKLTLEMGPKAKINP
jgi:predicted alpha-1,2-mannosidase